MNTKEYIERNRKVVTAPSGMEFTIRKIPPRTYSKITKLGGAVKKNISEEEAGELFFELMEMVFPTVILKPKIVLEPEEKDGVIHIDDVDMEDSTFLIDEIYKFTGLTEEKLKEIEEFRDQ